MKKKISIGLAIAIAVVAAVAVGLIAFQVSHIALQNEFEAKYLDAVQNGGLLNLDSSKVEYSEFITKVADKLAEVDAVYRNYYIGEIDDDYLMDSIMAGYVYGTGDDYASYYSAEAYEAQVSDWEGEMTGVGISVIYNADYNVIEVINVLPDSPALEAGVQAGDLIIYIGEEQESVSALGYNAAVDKMQGKDGTEAVFTVARGENYEETIEFRIIRAKVTEVTVMSHVYALDSTVGVIKVTGFDDKTPIQFRDAVNQLCAQGCTKLVMDMRNNPGGELGSVLTILDMLLPEGPMIRIFDKDNNEVEAYYSGEEDLQIPMAVLVNGYSASAAELFTAALRDYDKALIVGTTTYGKGCMQTTRVLSDSSAVSVTYRMYNSPYSENYHGVGIVPDVVVELDEALANKNIYKITDEEDNQLAAAVATFYSAESDKQIIY